MTPGDHITVTHRNRVTRPAEVIDVRGDSLRIRYTDVEHVEVDTVLRARCKPVKAPAPIQRTQVSMREAFDGLIAAGIEPVAYSHVRAVPKPPKPLRDARYLRHVRAQPCCVGRDGATTTPCSGPVVAHHHGPRGMGEKTDDYRTVPLCDGHHREFHDRGTIGEWPRADLDRSFTRVMSDVLMTWLWATDRFAAREHVMDALIAHIRETAA